MASYGLKYKAEFKNTKGHYYRIRIYQRGYTGSSKTIGYVAGAALELQGNQGEIIAPIIKTQLRVSLVDAADLAETSAVKYGDWQEFFTPDATLYKVVLGQGFDGQNYTDVWSGYITPDSWVEAIEYRGIITITARDGLGMLKDHPFEETGIARADENGLVSIMSILYEAGHVFEMPMDIVSHIGTSEVGYKPPRFSAGEYTDVSIESASVNAALFEGMDWYSVLEQTLEAIGCAIRYNGQNALVIMALRDLPKLGRSDGAFEYHPVEFYGCTLEFDPAVKRIVEEQDYKQRAEVDFPVFDGLQFNTGTTYRCKTEGNELPSGGTVSIPEHDAAMNTLSNKGETGWDVTSGMLNPASYEADDFLKRAEGVDGWRNYAFLAANQVLNGSAPVATYRFVTRTAAIKTTFRFTPNALSIRMSGSQTGRMMGPHYALANIKYYVMFTDGTTTRYWNGGQWTSTAILLEKEYDAQNQYETTLEINTAECTDITVGTFVVEFGQIVYKMWSDGGHGCYARVVEIKAEINSTTSIQSNKVTTVNDDAFNVVLTRKPLFGALSQEVSFVRPSNYLAALFTYTSYGSNPVACPYNFHFGSETPVPLPVLIHQQILCYYYGAARVLNGNCAPINNGMMVFSRICEYKRRKYLIQGGTLDLFSGVLTNAVLREYLDFDELWAGVTPSYSGGPTYQPDPASGGSGSGSGGGGGGGYVLPVASANTLGGVKVGTGLAIDANGVLAATGGGYVLPVASASELGGVKIGTGLSIDANGVLSATGGSSFNGGEITQDLWLHTGGSDYGSTLFFCDKNGNTGYAYIKEDSDDHLKIYARSGVTIAAGEGGEVNIQGLSIALGDVSGVSISSPTNGQALVYRNGTWRNETIQGGGSYVLPEATAEDLGGIKVGFVTSGKNYAVELDDNGNAYVNVPWQSGSGGSTVAWGTQSGDKIPLTVDGTTKNLLTDHQSLADYVTKGTQQTITGEKTFTTKPVNIGSSSGLKVDGASYIDIGDARLVYDATNHALHITMKSGSSQTIGLYADGFVSARGAAASGDQIKFVALTGNQTVAGVKTFTGNIIINGVTLTGSSSMLSVNKNASFAGITDKVGGSTVTHAVSIQDIINRIVALENA